MNTPIRSLAAATLVLASIVLPGCASRTVNDARASGVERRQDRMDDRSAGMQERWKTRADREDARSRARFDAM